MDLVGKLSVATMKCDPGRAKREGQEVPLARIMGTATNLKAAVDPRGETVFGLTGTFKGINIAQAAAFAAAKDKKGLSDGEYTSATLYLPGGLQGIVQEPLEAQMNSEDKAIAKGANVAFIMDLYAVPATNLSGYSFRATVLGDAAKADPFAQFTAQLSENPLPALPAPKAAA